MRPSWRLVVLGVVLIGAAVAVWVSRPTEPLLLTAAARSGRDLLLAYRFGAGLLALAGVSAIVLGAPPIGRPGFTRLSQRARIVILSAVAVTLAVYAALEVKPKDPNASGTVPNLSGDPLAGYTTDWRTRVPSSRATPGAIPRLDKAATSRDLSCLDTSAHSRPGTGILLMRARGIGLGRLTVRNGRRADAAVMLVDQASGVAVRGLYVRAGERAVVTGIPVGTYSVRFQLGRTWNDSAHAFCVDRLSLAFDDPFRFSESPTEDDLSSSTWEITLDPVIGGNARFHAVPDSETEIIPRE